jgi:hypothetical protein
MHRLVLVEWEDACGGYAGWLPLDETRIDIAYMCRSVGWLVAKNRDRIILASNMSVENERHGVHSTGEITIPRGTIRRIVDLSEKKRRRR